MTKYIRKRTDSQNNRPAIAYDTAAIKNASNVMTTAEEMKTAMNIPLIPNKENGLSIFR